MTLVATDYDADIAAAQRACSVDLHRYLGERFGKREDRLRPIAGQMKPQPCGLALQPVRFSTVKNDGAKYRCDVRV